MAAALKVSRERAERINKALIGTFFTQAMVSMAIVVRIPEIIDNLALSKNLAIWGTITGLSGIGSILALVFAHRLCFASAPPAWFVTELWRPPQSRESCH